MSTLKPFGSRIFVKDIQPIDEVTARAAKAGLTVALDKRNVPVPTSGVCIAVGSDPLIQEMVHCDDTVFFKKYSGTGIQIEGVELRALEDDDIITVLCPHDQATPSVVGSQIQSTEESGAKQEQKSSQITLPPDR